MIPPRPIEEFSAYPANTLEGMIARQFVRAITECEDSRIALEPIQKVIDDTRSLMREAGWPPIYQHNYLVQLRNDLTELTQCHAVARQFIQMLTIETEICSCIH